MSGKEDILLFGHCLGQTTGTFYIFASQLHRHGIILPVVVDVLLAIDSRAFARAER